MAIPFIDSVLDIIRGPLDKLIPDKDQQRAFAHELEMTILRSGMGQLEVNKAEASHPSLFVSGWRPFVGWVCGVALFWHFIGFDLLNWVRGLYWPDLLPLPVLGGADTLVTVLLSMLGLGGLRTVEKLKGVDRTSWPRN
ncbi:hypothetical protein GCM10017044_11020 [Kordiimonas sediminis]|uniref:Uncharacterized protein n=1 Tax=Kordiimonas sediminis TaxID=1735581 RepID=A0A919E6A0_9PROT|nr:3TM-type holin [Kordiimonas sediminis]GHF18299.1 hypothetical protein GCM10017044_11020 [Kordiimonas sediminis]